MCTRVGTHLMPTFPSLLHDAPPHPPHPDLIRAQVTLDGTQHAKLVDDVAAKVYGLIEPRLMAMAHYIVGTVSGSKPAATPPDPTPIR